MTNLDTKMLCILFLNLMYCMYYVGQELYRLTVAYTLGVLLVSLLMETLRSLLHRYIELPAPML